MIKLMDLLKESSSVPYEYGCAMLYFDFAYLNKIQDAINPKHIYRDEKDPSFGLEDEPHCTLLFGLHKEVSVEDVTKILKDFIFDICKLHNVSLFENEKYDVLKFDVEGSILHNVNSKLKTLPYTSDFPDYHPHSTIAYLKPGMGKIYTEMLKNQEFELQPQYAMFSQPDGSKNKIKIKLK
jgi:2'-5' RNA ligase